MKGKLGQKQSGAKEDKRSMGNKRETEKKAER